MITNIKTVTKTVTLVSLTAFIATLKSAYASDAAEMAKKMQNPLANIKAFITDNVIGFDAGSTEGTSFGFELQPVYAIDMPEKNMTLIPRAVIPIVGLEPGTRTPITGQDGSPIPPGSDRVWGLSDSIVQLFIAPYLKSSWKWGVGPQISLPTHTQSELKVHFWVPVLPVPWLATLPSSSPLVASRQITGVLMAISMLPSSSRCCSTTGSLFPVPTMHMPQ